MGLPRSPHATSLILNGHYSSGILAPGPFVYLKTTSLTKWLEKHILQIWMESSPFWWESANILMGIYLEAQFSLDSLKVLFRSFLILLPPNPGNSNHGSWKAQIFPHFFKSFQSWEGASVFPSHASTPRHVHHDVEAKNHLRQTRHQQNLTVRTQVTRLGLCQNWVTWYPTK